MKIVRCEKCAESFPEYLFEFGIAFRCACGSLVDRSQGADSHSSGESEARRAEVRPPKLTIDSVETAPQAVPSMVHETAALDQEEQERRARELRRRADRICYLIVSTEKPLREVEAEMHVLRDRCRRYFPEIRGAYEQVYEARFQKLWREFR